MATNKFRGMANVDSVITPTDEARVPVMDRGFLYGDSVYEVFRTYNGVPLFYEEHYQRLLNSARLIQMKITQSREKITNEIGRTVQATGGGPEQDVYVRYTITRGEGPVDLYPDPKLETRYVVIVKEVPKWNPDFYGKGMKMAIPAVRRNPVDALDPNIKGGNYLNNVLAITQARQLGADDCVILNHDGYVTEAANSNVFFVIDADLVTPSEAAGNLRGLTKGAILRACARHGLESKERNIHSRELSNATECFVTSATREVMPVRSLRLEDGGQVSFPAGGGDITRKVIAYYKEYVDDYIRDHADESFFK